MRLPKIVLAVFTFFFLTAMSATAQEFRFLWSDAHNEVLAKHNASLYTPVATPLPAIDWRFNRAEAQTFYYRAFPKDRVIVQETEVVGDQAIAEVEPETMNINGREVLIQEW